MVEFHIDAYAPGLFLQRKSGLKFPVNNCLLLLPESLPAKEEWIEIIVIEPNVRPRVVTTFAVVWIEIINSTCGSSPPSVTTFAVV